MGKDWPDTPNDDGEEVEAQTVKSEQLSKPEQFNKIDEALQRLKKETESVVASNGGKINPDSARTEVQGFTQRFSQIAKYAEEAQRLLSEANRPGDYCPAIAPFIANSGIGWVSQIAEDFKQYAGIRRIDDDEENKKWVATLQRFVDISTRLSEDLFRDDELVRFFGYRYKSEKAK